MRAAQVSTSAGDVALLVVGAVLVLSPFLIDRITGFAVTSASFEVRLSREVSDLGAPGTARILQRADLASFAESYAYIHEELADPAYRNAQVHLQDLLVSRSAAVASRENLNASEVRKLFRDGSPVMRVLAIGLMKGDCSLADSATIISAISDPRSRNEQYQGLKLARQRWCSLPGTGQRDIHLAICAAGIPADSARRRVADEILALPAR